MKKFNYFKPKSGQTWPNIGTKLRKINQNLVFETKKLNSQEELLKKIDF